MPVRRGTAVGAGVRPWPSSAPNPKHRRVAAARDTAPDRHPCILGAVRSTSPLLFALVLVGCGGAPLPPPAPEEGASPPPAARAADVPDDCAKPGAEPLKKKYTGVAAKARCQREVYTIMGGVTHFLGVGCDYCHVKNGPKSFDFEAMTERKRIANWMAGELIPRLSKKSGRDVWCNDCHVVNGQGKAKILGSPRDRKWAIEWMTTRLVADLQTAKGSALHCADCHGANIGSAGFQTKVILTDHLPAH